jgi:hypothetical protein
VTTVYVTVLLPFRCVADPEGTTHLRCPENQICHRSYW